MQLDHSCWGISQDHDNDIQEWRGQSSLTLMMEHYGAAFKQPVFSASNNPVSLLTYTKKCEYGWTKPALNQQSLTFLISYLRTETHHPSVSKLHHTHHGLGLWETKWKTKLYLTIVQSNFHLGRIHMNKYGISIKRTWKKLHTSTEKHPCKQQ